MVACFRAGDRFRISKLNKVAFIPKHYRLQVILAKDCTLLY